MVYGNLHIHHDLVSDENATDNSYSTPWRHDVCNMDQKIAMLVIGLCYNTLSHICVQHHHYPEHDTICPYIFFH